jgi:hypothetical protein
MKCCFMVVLDWMENKFFFALCADPDPDPDPGGPK